MATRSSSEDLKNKIKELEKNLVDCRQMVSQLQVSEEKYKNRYSKTKKSEMIYRSIIDSSADAIAIFDLNGMVKYVSPSFTEVFGWTKEAIFATGRLDNGCLDSSIIEAVVREDSF